MFFFFKTGFITKNKKPWVYTLRHYNIEEYIKCVFVNTLEKARSNFLGGGSKLCIFFFFFKNKLLHLHPSKCWTKRHIQKITPEATAIVFHWLLPGFPSFLFLRGKDEFAQVGGLLGNPKLLSHPKAACRGSQAEPVRELRQKQAACPSSYGRTDVLKTYFWTQKLKFGLK